MTTSIIKSLKSGAKSWMPALLVTAALMLSGAPPAWANNDGRDSRDRDRGEHDDEIEIVRPDERYRGKTYGQWAAAWWQWALSIPEAQNPLLDTTGQSAGIGQSGPVWFLAGTFGNSVERTVTVPAGKSIFMPVHNWIFGAGVFDCDPTAPGVCDLPTLREKAAAAATGAEIVEAWIDGDKVRNIRSYRGISPEPFGVTFPEGAVFGIPAGTHSPHVADGYWLMLTPPDKGRHTIRVHVVNSAAGIDMNLIVHLNVVKPAEIVPPNEKYDGRSYAEWSAKWWEWFLEFPVNKPNEPHPSVDSPKFDVRDGQDFDVWFLAAPFGTNARSITVPDDKALFFPMANVEVSNLEGAPFFGATAAAQRAQAMFLADHIVDAYCTVDGVPVGPASAFRVLSPQFRFDAPTPWLNGPTGGRGRAVGDGYYVLVEPLSKGDHTIQFGGAFHFDAGEIPEFGPDAADFSFYMTYHVRVR
ncbi:MAG TPA: hypothetical protein VNT99_01670 [Methylomirabilota bacterium]|nr:hypothetical protein [Methylomirabilota bacterium]